MLEEGLIDELRHFYRRVYQPLKERVACPAASTASDTSIEYLARAEPHRLLEFGIFQNIGFKEFLRTYDAPPNFPLIVGWAV